LLFDALVLELHLQVMDRLLDVLGDWIVWLLARSHYVGERRPKIVVVGLEV
jgi:hypothetical protein